MSFELQTILVLSLLSPIAELFPNLYMSWWVPTNNNLKSYLQASPRRVLAVLTVWVPILIVLANIIQPPKLIWLISTLVFSAFFLRLFIFDRYIRQKLKKSRLTATVSRIPETLYLIAFSGIGLVLYASVQENRWLVPAAILAIFLGASMISTFRSGEYTNISLDVIGRLVFTAGFLLNLYNLVRALEALTG